MFECTRLTLIFHISGNFGGRGGKAGGQGGRNPPFQKQKLKQ